MTVPFRAADESARRAALRRYRILDTGPERDLDDLTALAAHACCVPMAVIALVDEERHWVKSAFGWSPDQAGLHTSFCTHAMHASDLLVVPDASQDPLFGRAPFVTGPPHVRFYAGAPLLTPDGHALGTLCVMDSVARELSDAQRVALRALTRQVMSQLELRRQTRELVDSERRLRTIFENEPECVKLLDRRGMLLEMNPAGLRMIEADSLEQVAGRPVLHLVTPEYREAFAALTARTWQGESGTLEFEIQGLKGTRRWLETHAAPLRGPRGEVTALLGITREITERKRAEAALRQSEERLRLAVDAAQMGTFEWDIRANRLTWSAWHERLWGFQPGEFEGTYEAFAGRVHPEDLPGVNDEITRCIAARTLFTREFRVVWPDGSIHWIVARGEFEIAADGSRIRMRGVVLEITERKLADEALQQRTTQLQTALDMAKMGVWHWDGRTDRLLTLQGSGPVSGLPPDEYPHTTADFLALVHPDDRPLVVRQVERARERGTFETEYRIVRRNGAMQWVAARGALARDRNGEPLSLTGVDQDITARKLTEGRLQQLNRVYRMLSQINETIVRVRDTQAMLDAACRIAVEQGSLAMAWIGLVDAATGRLGIAAHHGATDDVLRVIQSAVSDETCACQCTRHAIAGGHGCVSNDIGKDPNAAAWQDDAVLGRYGAMALLPLRSGERTIGTLNLYAAETGFFDEQEVRLLGELATNLAFALEVHARERERRRVEDALRESEERFRQLAENLREVFWVTDSERTQVLYVSPAYEKIWGRRCEALYATPRDWIDGVHPDDRSQVLDAFMREPGGDYDQIYRIVRPDGAVRWIHDRAFPVRDQRGELVRIVGTASDITERRQLEEQVRQSQKMEAIGQLAGGVAHDFNNILTVVRGYGTLLADTQLPQDAREAAHQVVVAADRAAALTRQLLAFSRRQVIQPRLLDVNEIVISLTKMLQRVLGEDLHLQLNLHPRALMTRADAGMLDHVLLNLVVNARDAMTAGGRLVIETSEVTLTQHDVASMHDASAGRHVVLRVKDTGAGIAPEHLPHIFEPFFTTKEAGKGTGLGLATVFGIVKQHRGWIAVRSDPGRGTTFEVFLRAEDVSSHPDVEGAGTARLRPGSETILLVEDEPGVRMLARAVLERHGYNVLEAPNGVTALQVWEQHHDSIRLLLTDMVMPHGLSGRELASRLRSRNPALPVVFTSGYSPDIAGRELSLREGQNFLQKPFSPQQLLEIVGRGLDQQRL